MRPKLDVATVAGIASGIVLLLSAILLGGSLAFFIDIPSMLIVIGGTVAATLVNFPLREVMRVMKVLPRAFSSSFDEPVRIMKQLVELCGIAKRDGVLGLEGHVKTIDNRYFRFGIEMVVDGQDPAQVSEMMRLQTMAIQERHKTGRSVLEGMGTWAPAFGMIGTLIGLILMMANMSDPSQIGPKMAVALLTTFYGAVMANLIFLPMAGKLKRLTEIELVTNQIIREGIVGIHTGSSPMTLESKLKSFLETAHQGDELKNLPVGA